MGETENRPNMEWRIAPWTDPVITSNIPIECPCTVVWHNGQFVLKFKSALCILHRKVQQNMHGTPRYGKPRTGVKPPVPRIRFTPAASAVSGTARVRPAVPRQTRRKIAS